MIKKTVTLVSLLTALGATPSCKRPDSPEKGKSVPSAIDFSTKEKAQETLRLLPHVYLDDKQCARYENEQDVTKRNYEELQQGLATLRTLPDDQKGKQATRLYNLQRYFVTTQQFMEYYQTLKEEFCDKNYAIPLVAILGDIRLTDSSKEREEKVVESISVLIYEPEYQQVQAQAVFSLGGRAFIPGVRHKVRQTLRNIILNEAFSNEVKQGAGFRILQSYLHEEEEVDIEMVAGQPHKKHERMDCWNAKHARKLLHVMSKYIAAHSKFSTEELRGVLQNDFLIFVSDRLLSDFRERQNQSRHVTGNFAGGALYLRRGSELSWTAAHEAVHGLGFHLKMRRAARDDKEFRKKYGTAWGSPFAMEELVTQQIVNEAVANLTGVPLAKVPFFLPAYGSMLERPEFQKIYQSIIGKAGSREIAFNTFFIGTAGEKNSLYKAGIKEAYGDNGFAAIKKMNPANEQSVEETLTVLRRL